MLLYRKVSAPAIPKLWMRSAISSRQWSSIGISRVPTESPLRSPGRLNALLGEGAYRTAFGDLWGKMVAEEGLEPPTRGL